jgi:hypothetical protein
MSPLPYKRLNETAVAIFSFNRPNYFDQVLSSLEKNTYLEGLDFYLFQDGAINKFSGRVAADEEDIQACVHRWESSSLPNKQLILNEWNVGMCINWLEATSLLFDSIAYDQVLFFEDDLVVNRNYVRSLRILLDQFRGTKKVAAVTCHGGRPKVLSEAEKKANLLQLSSGCDHLWGWASWRDRWQQIKPTFLEYHRFIEGCDSKQKPNKEIVDFYISKGFNIKSTSQDSAYYYAIVKNDMFTINTVLHRGEYIGAYGDHMTPEIFEKTGYPTMKFIDCEEDGLIERFEGYDEEKFLKGSKSICLPKQA